MLLERDWLCECPRDGEAGFPGEGAPSPEGMDEEKGMTPARWAISCSPRRQCIASTARQGMTSSSATLAHISALNLVGQSQLFFLIQREKRRGFGIFLLWGPGLEGVIILYLSYSLASLSLRSSVHGYRLSR